MYMATLSKASNFDPKLVSDLINKVKGHSSLAVLSAQEPVPFVGSKEFVFSFDSEVDVVAENGKKSHGGISVTPITIMPIKVEYGARVSDEFMFAAEEEQINILQAFNEGFAKKLAKGLDIMAMHGVNPRTGNASSVIGTNHFDSKVTETVEYDEDTPDTILEAAIKAVEDADGDVTGIAISPTVRADLAKMSNNAGKIYPDFAFGGKPNTLGGNALDVNKTVSYKAVDEAIVGDFANMFKWGIAKDIPVHVIEYGDPDGSGNDLKAYNQVYIRAEAYIGWAIADGTAFARVVPAADESNT